MTLLSTALALLLESSIPYPIPPQPLRWMYRAADLVVVAKAGPTTSLGRQEDRWEDSKVVLTIDRTLKGKSDGNEVTVFYCPNMICPAPDHYPEGKTVLALLNWNAKLKGYSAVALSYSSKDLEKDALKTYVERIEELDKIPFEKPGEKPSDQTIEWLVRCMEDPSTRWEGAFEFSGPTFTFGKLQEERQAIPPTRLGNAQWKRTIEALVISKGFSGGESCVLSMILNIPDPRIDRYLITQLKRCCGDKQPWYGGQMMTALAQRLELKEGLSLAKRFDELKYDDAAGRVTVILKFLELVDK